MNTIKALTLFTFSFLLSSCNSDNSEQQTDAVSADIAATSAVTRLTSTIPTVRNREQQLLTQEYAAFRKSQLSNPAYTLSLELSANSDTFKGKVNINVELAANNISPVTIDFDSGEINAISINGNPINWDYEHWYISLEAEYFKPGNNTITIEYQRPYATDGAGLHKFIDPENGEIYLYTNFEPYDANRLFPHFDQPNLKAPITLDVIAPASWQVIANTREIEINTDGNLSHWFFPASAPISSYIYAMHAGPFTMWEDQAGDIPLRLFARSSLAEFINTEDWFTPTQQSFAFFQDYFDVPYPFDKYDQVIVPDFNAGAMENVAAVTFSERYISRGEQSILQRRRIASVISHEMAHMWFGDLVTMDWWNGLWLNESFASYMGNLALDHATEFENVWDTFYLGDKLWAYETDQLITTHPVELEVATTADAFTNFDGITYGKGGSILKQLPFLLGEENFRLGVSNYIKKYSYQNTTLNDFVSELALAANINLDQWQHEWLYQSGVNTLTVDFSCNNDAITSLRLIQSVSDVATADKVLRSQRTQIGLYRYIDEEMLVNSAIAVTYSGVVTNIVEAVGKPCPDLVFPNEDDWAFAKINFDEKSVATLNQHINDFSSPTTRIMLWQSLWDSVESSQLPLTDFVNFALNNIGEESDDNVVRLVSEKLDTAFYYYSLLGRHMNDKDRIEAFYLQQLNNAQPGSELQKIWYSNFIDSAHSLEALNYLNELLDGSQSIADLEIDQDKRWSIIIAFNRYQYGDYETLLATESTLDSSDQGINMRLAAQAIRPDVEIKESLLNTIINQPETMKLAALRTTMGYLFPAEQSSLRTRFSEQILAAIPNISANASQEYLGEYVDRLSIAACTATSVARLQQANEDFALLQPLVVKAYLIRHQEDQRCVEIGALLEQ